MILAVPLAAGGAYLLCRELSDRLLPSLVGGLLFGLSPYMLGHTLSQHLNLVFVFPLPLVALCCLRYVRGKTSPRRLVAILALLLLLQLGSSLELFADLTLFVALGLGFALAGGVAQRGRLVRLGGLVVAAYLCLLPVLLPVAIFAFGGSHTALAYAPASYAIDLANLVVPTATVLAGALHATQSVTQHFVGNVGEQDGYLGVPLIAVVLAALVGQWRRGAWLLGALLLAALLFSFGPLLTLAGHPLLALPFALDHLPVLSDALPARLSIFSALAASVLVALWLGQARRRWLQLSVAGLLLVSLLPNFWPPAQLPGAWAISTRFGYVTSRASPGFVADPLWRRLIAPGATVLVLPTGALTAASWWQVESGLRFALAVPDTPFAPPTLAGTPVMQGLLENNLPSVRGDASGGRPPARLPAQRPGGSGARDGRCGPRLAAPGRPGHGDAAHLAANRAALPGGYRRPAAGGQRRAPPLEARRQHPTGLACLRWPTCSGTCELSHQRRPLRTCADALAGGRGHRQAGRWPGAAWPSRPRLRAVSRRRYLPAPRQRHHQALAHPHRRAARRGNPLGPRGRAARRHQGAALERGSQPAAALARRRPALERAAGADHHPRPG